jgi:hypothetical protein
MIWGELVVILDRLHGDLVTEEAKVEDGGMGEKVQESCKR